MTQADVKFERENIEGLIPIGTYLFDAARRIGIDIEDECGRRGECDSCAVTVTKGMDLLSEVTKAEKEQLSEARLKKGERLTCQVKVEKAGEIVIMTKEKKVEEKPAEEKKKKEYKKEFRELPLEKKIASLVELEAIALSDTFSFVLNSPSHIVGKFMDVLAEFGLKMEREEEEAKRPEEHKSVEDETGEEKTAKSVKERARKTTKKAAKKKTDEKVEPEAPERKLPTKESVEATKEEKAKDKGSK